MKEIFVFDMGCVILKPSYLDKMYEEANTDCEYKVFKDLFYNSEYSQKVYDGTINDDEFFKIIKEKTNSKKNIEELKMLYLKYKGDVYSSTMNIIKKLKEDGNTICLLSNLKELDYNYLSNVIDMNLFDKTYLSYLMKMSKPNKKIFQKVINDLGTNRFYFFDDSIKNIEAAKNLGINAYNVTGENIEECFEKKLILRK